MSVQLKEVIQASQPRSVGLDIVFVHGVTTAGLPGLTNAWKDSLPKLVPKNSNFWLLTYDANSSLDDGFVWADFSVKADELLEAAFWAHTPLNENPRPMVFVCYSWSGLLLKQMLWRASQEHRFRSLLRDVVSGVIFLATPHIVHSDAAGSRTLSTILRRDLKPKLKRLFAQADLSGLVLCGHHFEELQLDIPILSCYETRPTKIKSVLWFSRKVVLVDKALVRTSAPGEILVPIEDNLPRIFDHDNNVIHLRIKEYLVKIMKDAPQRLRKAHNSALNARGLLSPTRRLYQATQQRSSGTTAPESSLLPYLSLTPPSSGRLDHPSLHSESSSLSAAMIASIESSKSDGSYDMMSDFASTVPRVTLPCYYIREYPKPNPDFCGRDGSLKHLDDALLPDALFPGLKTFSLCGPGGIGKTQIAVQYFHQRKEDFDAMFWVPAGSTEKLANGFSKISIRLGLEVKADASDAVVSRELVKHWLEDPCEGNPPQKKRVKWLLIFDGADNPDILHDYWPQALDGSILITSRDPLMKTSMFSVAAGGDLDTLPPNEAAALLKKLLDDKSKTLGDTLLKIVQKLNCYPLAIVQMAGVMWRMSLKPDGFLDIYDHESGRAELHDLRIGSQRNYPLTLSSTWALDTLSCGAKCLLSVISLLDSEHIPESIFTTNPARGELRDLPISKPSYSMELSELLKTSLVRRNQDENELWIHSIIQDVVRAKLMTTPDQLTAVFIGTVKLITTVWPYVSSPQLGYPAYDRVDRWEQCEKILPHIVRLREFFCRLQSDGEKRNCATSDFLWLLAELAWYYLERSNAQDCLDTVDIALKIHEYHASGPRRDLLAELHGTRGIMAMEVNQAEEALYHIETHMNLRLEKFKDTKQVDSKLAAAYTEMGRALMLNGLFSKAKEAFTESIKLRRQMPNFTPLQLFTSLRGLALVAWHQEDYEQAAALLLEALSEREKAFGPNDREGPRTGHLLYHLGSVRSSQNKPQAGFAYYHKALLHYRKTIGDFHFYTAHAAHKLAEYHVKFDDHETALKYLDLAFKVFSRGSFYTPDLARSQFLRSVVLTRLGRTSEARGAAEDALGLRRRLAVRDERSFGQLSPIDFDELVAFWFR